MTCLCTLNSTFLKCENSPKETSLICLGVLRIEKTFSEKMITANLGIALHMSLSYLTVNNNEKEMKKLTLRLHWHNKTTIYTINGKVGKRICKYYCRKINVLRNTNGNTNAFNIFFP